MVIGRPGGILRRVTRIRGDRTPGIGMMVRRRAAGWRLRRAAHGVVSVVLSNIQTQHCKQTNYQQRPETLERQHRESEAN